MFRNPTGQFVIQTIQGESVRSFIPVPLPHDRQEGAAQSRCRSSSNRPCTRSQAGGGPKQSMRHWASNSVRIIEANPVGGNRASLLAKLIPSGAKQLRGKWMVLTWS